MIRFVLEQALALIEILLGIALLAGAYVFLVALPRQWIRAWRTARRETAGLPPKVRKTPRVVIGGDRPWTT